MSRTIWLMHALKQRKTSIAANGVESGSLQNFSCAWISMFIAMNYTNNKCNNLTLNRQSETNPTHATNYPRAAHILACAVSNLLSDIVCCSTQSSYIRCTCESSWPSFLDYCMVDCHMEQTRMLYAAHTIYSAPRQSNYDRRNTVLDPHSIRARAPKARSLPASNAHLSSRRNYVSEKRSLRTRLDCTRPNQIFHAVPWV